MDTRVDDRVDEDIGNGVAASVAEGDSSRKESLTSPPEPADAPVVEQKSDETSPVEGFISVLQDARRSESTLENILDIVDLGYGQISTAQLCILYAGSDALRWAREHPVEFDDYCDQHMIGGESTETKIADIVQKRDPDYASNKPNRTTRAEYANAMAWFADDELCPFDGTQAIKEAMRLGRIAGIAERYREKRKKLDQKTRTEAATRAREEQRRAKEAAAAAEMAAVQARHEEEAARRKAEKEAAVKAALTQPFVMPPEPTVSAPLSTYGDEPTASPASAEAEVVEDKPGTSSVVGEAEPEAQAEAVEQTPLSDIEDHLRQLLPDPTGWNLNAHARRLLEQDKIVPVTVSDMMVPRAAVAVWFELANPSGVGSYFHGPVIDHDLCIDTVVKRIEERRILAAAEEAGEEAEEEGAKPKARRSRARDA